MESEPTERHGVAPRPSAAARKIDRGVLYMLGSALAFSAMTLLVKLVGQHLPSQEIVFFRALVSLFLSYALIRRAGIPALGHRRGLLLVRGLCGFGGLSCVFYSVTHIPLAEATVIQYLHPTFTALLAAVVLRERISGLLWVASVICLSGVAMVARPAALFGSLGLDATQPLDPFVVMVAVGGALFSAAAYVVVRRLNETEDPLVIVLYFPLVAVPATLPTLWSIAVWPTPIEWLLLLGVGVTAQAGQVFLTVGLRHLPAARGTAISYFQVVFATIWGLLFFAEIPGFWTIVGTGLIVVGTFFAARDRSR